MRTTSILGQRGQIWTVYLAKMGKTGFFKQACIAMVRQTRSIFTEVKEYVKRFKEICLDKRCNKYMLCGWRNLNTSK